MSKDEHEREFEDDSLEPDAQTARLSERLASIGRGDAQPAPEPLPSQGGRSHFVSPPGQVVVGARMPTPTLSPSERDTAVRRHQLFTSTKDRGTRGLASRAALLAACAMAAGTSVALFSLVDDNGPVDEVQRATQGQSVSGDRVLTEAIKPGSDGEPGQIIAAVSAMDETLDRAGPTRVARAQADSLEVGDITVEAGRSTVPLNISVNRDNSGEYAFLMFRGFDELFSLSAGFRMKDAWAVSLGDVAGLTLNAPDDYAGRLDLEVMLVRGRNQPVEREAMTVTFKAPETELAPPAKAVRVPPPAPSTVPQVLTAAPPAEDADVGPNPDERASAPASAAETPRLTISTEVEARMLERAFDLLGKGDVVSARLVLEHLARKGSGKGALALGQTYDPAFFNSIETLGGPQPDPAMARKWYRMADQLGQVGAQQRLEVLAAE